MDEQTPQESSPSTEPLTKEGLMAILASGKIVVVDGRTAHDEAGIDFLLSVSPEAPIEASDTPEADASMELLGSAESELTNETTVPLLPGVAVYLGPGASTPFSDGPKWCAPGDFQCFLEEGGDANPGQFRELLVGPFRAFDLDNDHELPEGTFLDELGWDSVVGRLRREIIALSEQIGIPAFLEQPDESKPLCGTWLAERSSWETEVERLKEHIVLLEGKLAVPAPAPAPSALPANALELIQTAGGLSKPKAEAVLAVLQVTGETSIATTEEISASSESQEG
jgi:hypothetical protein